MRRLLPSAALVTSFVLGAASLRAEIFVLKSGGRIEGELLNAGRQRGEPFEVRTGEGVRLALAEASVQRVIAKTDLDREYEERRPKLKNTVEDQWNMAEWCLEVGLTEQRTRHLQNVIEIDPDHEEARKALGFRRYGSHWLTPEQYMESLGYSRYKGAWRLKQEIEIESRAVERELAEKKLRKDIRTWFEHLASGGRYAELADRNLKEMDDPAAALTLTEILVDRTQPRASRLLSLSLLSKIAPGAGTSALIRLAMDDTDAAVSEACLEELQRLSPQASLPAFLAELKGKDNARINRAAECIERVGDKTATVPLINALVTEHRFAIPQGGAPGSMTTTFGNNSLGGGGGGLAMGGKPKIVKQQVKNPSVLAALATLHPGVNFQYDTEAWLAWYVQNHTATNIDLRRDD